MDDENKFINALLSQRNPYYSTVIFRHKEVTYVLLSEHHSEKTLEETPGYHFATILKKVIDDCQLHMDMYIEDRFIKRRNYRIPKSSIIDYSRLTPIGAVMRMALNNERCSFVRGHAIDTRAVYEKRYALWNMMPNPKISNNKVDSLYSVVKDDITDSMVKQVIDSLKSEITHGLLSFWNEALHNMSVLNIESFLYEFDYFKKILLHSLKYHPYEYELTEILNTTISYSYYLINKLYDSSDGNINICGNVDCEDYAKTIYNAISGSRMLIMDYYTLVRMTKSITKGYKNLRVFYGGIAHVYNLQAWMRMLKFDFVFENIISSHTGYYQSQGVIKINEMMDNEKWRPDSQHIIRPTTHSSPYTRNSSLE